MPRVACPVCAHPEAAELGAKGGHVYLRCGACRLVYARDIPTPEQFAAAYGHYGVGRPSLAAEMLKLLPLVAWARLRSRRARAGRPLRFLDIGSNTGFHTEAARRLGCEAHGLEINPKTVAMARTRHPRCTFHAEELAEFAARGLKFDAIYCSEVIEHVPDVRGFARALGEVALPRAVLFITTPDAGHWRVPRDVLAWRHVIPVQHLRLFDRGNLAALLADFGWLARFRLSTTRTNLRLHCTRRATG